MLSLSISYLAVYKYIFTAALCIAELLFLNQLPKRSHYCLRFLLCFSLMALLVSLYPTGSNNAIFNAIMFSVFFFATLPAILFCYRIKLQNAIFCGIAGYTVQHISSIIYTVICTLGGFGNAIEIYSSSAASFDFIPAAVFLEIYVLVYWIMYRVFGKQIRREDVIAKRSPVYLLLMTLMLLVEVLLSTVVTEQYSASMVVRYYLCASLTNLLCSLMILVFLFETMLHQAAELDLQVLQQMQEQERRQYQLSKETIDIINIKCHDMKHQIHNIRKTECIQSEALREIQHSISIYDSFVKTDNEALNVILAEKGLYCQHHGITINCMIDGQRLDFMRDVDIYSLFGNILDNAIHSVLELSEDKRCISLSVKARDRLLIINSNNYYEGEIRMENGLPLSSRQDTGYHGFGVRSIQQIVNKYNGHVTFDIKDNIFDISIMFPISAKTP